MSRKERSLFEAYDDVRQRDGASPIVQSVCYARAETEPASKPRQLVHILATGGIKRDGYEIVPSGWVLDDYVRNPLVLWRHSTYAPEDIMGNGEAWLSSAGGLPKHLRGRTTFTQEGRNPTADMVHGLYADGVLTAVSVRWDEDGDDSIEEITPEEITQANIAGVNPFALRFGGIRFKRARLQEYSMVPLGMDKDALTQRLRSADPRLVDSFIWKPELRTADGRTIFSLEGYTPEVDGPMHIDLKKRQDAPAPPEPTPEPTPVPEPAPEPDPVEPEAAPEVEPEAEAVPEAEPTQHGRATIPFSVHGNVPKASSDTEWDGSAARKAIAVWASSDGTGDKDTIDWDKYRRGFLGCNPEKPEVAGSFVALHHTVLNGRFVVVRAAVIEAAQRLQQGAFAVSEDDLASMRQHLASEYARFDEKPPWITSAGKQYEQLHTMLRESSGAAADALRTAIVHVAEGIWEDERVREIWEPRELPEGDPEIWESARTVLAGGLAEFVEDPEEQDIRADVMLFALDESIGGVMREHMAHVEFRRQLATAIGLPESESDWQAQVLERISDLTDEIPTPARTQEVGDERMIAMEARMARLRKAQEKVTGKTKGTSILDRVAGGGS